MNTPAHSHRLKVTLFLASAVVTLLSSCTEVPATTANSAPIAFCHATVSPSLSRDFEKMIYPGGRSSSRDVTLQQPATAPTHSTADTYVQPSVNTLDEVGYFDPGALEQAVQYEPAEGMINDVKIEPLTPADKDQLEKNIMRGTRRWFNIPR